MPANPPYQRCSKLDKLDRIVYPAILQRKADGMFVNSICLNNEMNFVTRDGNNFELPCHEDAFKRISTGCNLVFHGEAIVSGLDRHTSNGLMNRLVQKDKMLERLLAKNNLFEPVQDRDDYKQIQENTVIHLWDVLPFEDWLKGECSISYGERFEWLNGLWWPDNIQIIESQIVYGQEQAMNIAEKYIRQGYEGAVLKNINTGWKNHTSPNQIKLKNVEECDLKVIDWIEGKGKYKNMMGALVCESDDGVVKVEVGTGFTDEQRTIDYVGTIIRVLYEKVTESKSKTTYSLSHPRFDEVRADKIIADDYETIKAKQKVGVK